MVSVTRGKLNKSQQNQANEAPEGDQFESFEDLDQERQAANAKQETQNAKERNFLEALRKAYQGDLNYAVLNNTTLLNNLSNNYEIESGFQNKADGEPITFRHKKSGNTFSITKDEIKFKDGNKNFTMSDAMEMAKFALLDKTMQKEGITLNGSPQERMMLQVAIKELEKSIPKAERIKIHNKQTRGLLNLHLPGMRSKFERLSDQAHTALKKYKKEESTDFKQEGAHNFKPEEDTSAPGGTTPPGGSTEPGGTGNDGDGNDGSTNDDGTTMQVVQEGGTNRGATTDLSDEAKATLSDKVQEHFRNATDRSQHSKDLKITRAKLGEWLKDDAGVKADANNINLATAFLVQDGKIETKEDSAGRSTRYVVPNLSS